MQGYLLWAIDDKGGSGYVGAGDLLNFCYQPKTAVKNKFILKGGYGGT